MTKERKLRESSRAIGHAVDRAMGTKFCRTHFGQRKLEQFSKYKHSQMCDICVERRKFYESRKTT
jgi:hypothetical protein